MSGSYIDSQWFREVNSNWPGYSVCLKIEKILFQGSSEFQEILIFKSETFGVVLVLNGIMQCTERDEFSYQEMIAHLPLSCHPQPKRVLVIGGGDGGVVREVLKHSMVERVILCEIDQMVTDLCIKHMPSMACCLEDERVTVCFDDGVEFLKRRNDLFDIIITDAPDPFGVAEGLYEKEYYQNIKKNLSPGGIMCCQGESTWFDLSMIKQMMEMCKDIFPCVAYAAGNTPTYAGGQIGFLLCSSLPDADLTKPLRRFCDEDLKQKNIRYYNSDLHSASFVLPEYVREALQLPLPTSSASSD